MTETSIECRYSFTEQEFKRAQRAYQKAAGITWRRPFILALLGAVILGQALPLFYSSTSSSSDRFAQIVPCLFFIGIMTWVWTAPARAFRKSSIHNQEFIYAIHRDGFRLTTPLLQVNMSWNAVNRAVEMPDSFVLITIDKRSFHWLPKSGFSSPNGIDQTRLFIATVPPAPKGPPKWRTPLLCAAALIAVFAFFYFFSGSQHSSVQAAPPAASTNP